MNKARASILRIDDSSLLRCDPDPKTLGSLAPSRGETRAVTPVSIHCEASRPIHHEWSVLPRWWREKDDQPPSPPAPATPRDACGFAAVPRESAQRPPTTASACGSSMTR